MAQKRRVEGKRLTSEEEDTLMTVSEDRRLLRQGIDPDASPIEVLLAAHRNLRQLEAEQTADTGARAAEKEAKEEKP